VIVRAVGTGIPRVPPVVPETDTRRPTDRTGKFHRPVEAQCVALADRAGVNGVIFGATVLAAASALPEISSGIAAVKLGDNGLAMGDIFGGNAFQVCLFLVADLVAGAPVLPAAGRLNSWLAALGIGLTVVYAAGVIVRPSRTFARLGADSIAAIVLFALGMGGLFALPH
jgi:cation:H+ antiporter